MVIRKVLYLTDVRIFLSLKLLESIQAYYDILYSAI